MIFWGGSVLFCGTRDRLRLKIGEEVAPAGFETRFWGVQRDIQRTILNVTSAQHSRNLHDPHRDLRITNMATCLVNKPPRSPLLPWKFGKGPAAGAICLLSWLRGLTHTCRNTGRAMFPWFSAKKRGPRTVRNVAQPVRRR